METVSKYSRNLSKLTAPSYSVLQDEVTDAMLAVQPVGKTLRQVAAPVAEMNMYNDRNAEWWNAVRREHLFSLTSSDNATRTAAIQNVIHFACFYGDQIDLEPTTLILLAIYNGDPDRKNRLLALAALDLIGSEAAIHCLASGTARQSDPIIRRITCSVVNRYVEEHTRN